MDVVQSVWETLSTMPGIRTKLQREVLRREASYRRGRGLSVQLLEGGRGWSDND